MSRLTPLLCCGQLLFAIAAAAEPAAPPSPRYVRIGHYQCVCQPGDFPANLAKVVEGLRLAAEARLDIVCFPECLLTGYFSREEDARANAFAVDSPSMNEVLEKTAAFESMFLVGFTERRGDDLCDTVAVIERGRLVGCYRKAFPVYAYFTPGREFPVFEKQGLTFGVVICADGGYIEPCRILALKGAQLIFAPHFNFVADPVEHYQMVRADHIARAVENGVYFVRGNNVVPGNVLEGSRGGGMGYGDSYVLDPNGQIVAGAGLFSEYLMIYNLDLEKRHRAQGIDKSIRSAVELLDQVQAALPKGR